MGKCLTEYSMHQKLFHENRDHWTCVNTEKRKCVRARECVCVKMCICFRSNFHVEFLGMGQVSRLWKDILYVAWSWVRVSGIFAVKYANFSVSLFEKCGLLWQSAERAVLSMAKITKKKKKYLNITYVERYGICVCDDCFRWGVSKGREKQDDRKKSESSKEREKKCKPKYSSERTYAGPQ